MSISDVKIYPNPTSDILHIKCEECVGEKYNIISANGQSITDGIIRKSPYEVNVSSFAPGIYYININNVFLNYKEKINIDFLKKFDINYKFDLNKLILYINISPKILILIRSNWN